MTPATPNITVDVRAEGWPTRAAIVSRRRPRPPAHSFLTVVLAAGLLFEFGAFRLQLAGNDPSVPTDTEAASMIVQILIGSVILGAGGLLLCSRRAGEMLLGTWPMFLMPAMAFASMLWSPDPGYTFRKSVAFTGSVLIGFLVATVLNTQDAVRLLGRVLSFIVVLSVVYVFLFPHYGVHNASDFFQSVHAGHWRGVFSHRTALGHVAGVSFGLLICYGRLIWSSRILRYVIMVLSLACIIQAGSGGGFLTAAIFPSALLLTQRLTRIKAARRRRTVLLLLLATTLPLILFVPKLITAGLSVLNKQADLTGRVPLWDTLLVLAQEHLLLGYGYAAGFRDEIQPQILAATGNLYAHCHNGYLEVLMAFGCLGLGILMAVIVWLLTTTGRLVVAPPAHLGHLSGFPFIVVIYALGANCIESYLIIECNAVSLLALAAGLATRARIEARDLQALTARFGRD